MVIEHDLVVDLKNETPSTCGKVSSVHVGNHESRLLSSVSFMAILDVDPADDSMARLQTSSDLELMIRGEDTINQ